MARRRVRAEAVAAGADGYLELVHGPYGRHWCPWLVEVGRPSCEGHRGTSLDGFDADGHPCLSRFVSPAEREATYWAERDELVVQRCERGPEAGSRPWAWWVFEAPGVCRCRPRCSWPAGYPWPDGEDELEWLEAHGVVGDGEVARARRDTTAAATTGNTSAVA